MGNLVTGAIIILIYFLFKEYYDKKAFIKSAKLFSEQFNPDAYETVLNNISPQKKTFYYLLQKDCLSFRSLQKNKPDINISNLQYQVRQTLKFQPDNNQSTTSFLKQNINFAS